MFIQQFFNIDMASNQDIPFEDEVTPRYDHDGDNNNQNGSDVDLVQDGAQNVDPEAHFVDPPQPSQTSSAGSDNESSEAMRKIERTVAAMNKKLKKLTKKNGSPNVHVHSLITRKLVPAT